MLQKSSIIWSYVLATMLLAIVLVTTFTDPLKFHEVFTLLAISQILANQGDMGVNANDKKKQ